MIAICSLLNTDSFNICYQLWKKVFFPTYLKYTYKYLHYCALVKKEIVSIVLACGITL